MMFQLTGELEREMLAAQDRAAATFWTYPEEEWQMVFQADWLYLNCKVTLAQGPDEHVWGE